MDTIENLLAGSFAGLFITFYYIKILLKKRGYKINLVFNQGQDYQNFKKLIENERNFKKKLLYQSVRFPFIFFAGALIVIAIVGVIGT